MDDDEPLDLRRYLGLLWRRAWLVLLCAVVFAAVGWLVARQQDARYQASASVQVLDPNADQVFDGEDSRVDLPREVQTQAKVMRSKGVRARAEDALGPPADEIADVSASIQPDTNIVNVRVVATTPETARDGANAIADAYLARRRESITTTFEGRAGEFRTRAAELNAAVDELTTRIQDDPSDVEADVWRARRTTLVDQAQDFERRASEQDVEANVRSASAQVVEGAELPDEPFDPRPLRDALLCGFVGLLFGVVLVLLLDRLDDKVTIDDVESVAGMPVLGVVELQAGRGPLRRGLPSSPPRLLGSAADEFEPIRAVQTSVRQAALGNSVRSIMITSPSGAEGKSTITASLAMALAESGVRVVAVSADLRHPSLAGLFDVDESGAGLTTVLSAEASVPEVSHRVPTTNGILYVVPAGHLPANSTEQLESAAMRDTLTWLKDAGSDFILVDAPPVLAFPDATTLSRAVDAVVMVCVPRQTKRADLRAATDRLRQTGSHVLGAVVNGVPRSAPEPASREARAEPATLVDR